MFVLISNLVPPLSTRSGFLGHGFEFRVVKSVSSCRGGGLKGFQELRDFGVFIFSSGYNGAGSSGLGLGERSG